MAIAGGVCSAYRCQVVSEELQTQSTSMLRSMCASPENAVDRLSRGESVVVAGADMSRLRTLLAPMGIAQQGSAG
jgi:hypothetical protein